MQRRRDRMFPHFLCALLMAIALVTNGQIAGNANGGTSGVLDTSGASLLVISVCQYSGVAAQAPTDSKSNTWTALTEQKEAIEASNRLYYVANPTVGSGHTFTVAATGIFSVTQIAAFSGVKTSSPFDQQNGNKTFDSISSFQPGSVTPGEDNELIIAAIAASRSTTFSINSSMTITNSSDYNSGVSEGGALAYLVQSSFAAINPTWSFTPTVPISVAATIATFKAAAGGATVVPWARRFNSIGAGPMVS